ncbi:DNA polymerase III subunit chi [Roseateles asaccharophilus]|uniref:DNA polymerase-3 subunit chi n=1 Tax=Roseateles asaccharophilus TaxID=582607 RepID=A0ABU2AAJ6_9BURK|nr:DNA polymerase III subunit chi [Roseateles asaccharophilus]MDR7334201.1 DNA polymerase-3 subunit chi [Roseateles asaccharophilus]
MPQQVSFYSEAAEPLRFACRLVRRALASGKPLGICVPPGQAAALDALLWGFDASEFIPHRRWDGVAPPLPGEVLLVQDAAQLPHRGLLLNLGEALPAAAFEFERVLEVVGQSPDEVQAGRVRYRAYKQSGASLDHFTASG